MPIRPILTSAARIAAERDRSALLRQCIERLLSEPAVARRVQAGLAGAAAPPTLALVRALGRRPVCSGIAACGRLDCLCGRFPHRLTDREIRDGRVPERLVA